MNFNAICRGCVPPKLCLGVLSSALFVVLVGVCLIVGWPVGRLPFCRQMTVFQWCEFGVAIDAKEALKGLASYSVWNASVLPTTRYSPPPVGVVELPGVPRNGSPCQDRPSTQGSDDFRQERPLPPASPRTLFLCPAKGAPSRRLFSRRNQQFPRRP
jgi:hypothetical protein